MLTRFDRTIDTNGVMDIKARFDVNHYEDISKQLDSDFSELYSRLGVGRMNTETSADDTDCGIEKHNTRITMPDRVIFNGPSTIAFWPDGTKIVVKCSKGDRPNRRTAILWCIVKKYFGTTSSINKKLDYLIENVG